MYLLVSARQICDKLSKHAFPPISSWARHGYAMMNVLHESFTSQKKINSTYYATEGERQKEGVLHQSDPESNPPGRKEGAPPSGTKYSVRMALSPRSLSEVGWRWHRASDNHGVKNVELMFQDLNAWDSALYEYVTSLGGNLLTRRLPTSRSKRQRPPSDAWNLVRKR